MEKLTVDVVEIATELELEVEPKDMTELLLSHDKTWRRQWRPTPVFLPGESQGQQSLVGCHLWGRTELDTTEVT